MGFTDFQALKASVTFADAIDKLGLEVKQTGQQWRGKCPNCKTGGDRALVVTEGKGFYCFAGKKGGDQLALVAHVRGSTVKEAADFLTDGNSTSDGTSSGKSTSSESERGAEGKRTLEPLSYLEPDHVLVSAIGFGSDFAKTHGIGYAGKGVARGHVLVPFRDAKGTLLGYIGLDEPCWLPKEFQD